MKLTAIALHNHLSHADTRVEFNGTRLAAFVGPNGAGKSALLEALRYILFDDARAKTDQLVRIGSTDMSATVEFEFAGATYRAVRGRSTKGAGKTYLELHVAAPDGSWTPMTGDDIRDTQARIAELLGLDADTFATAVFLGQGEADRFAAATAGERKRILSTVLGLDIYARAEARAREEARDLEARSAAERSQCERLNDAIAELDGAKGRVAVAEANATANEAERVNLVARRDAAEAALRAIAGELATYRQAAADLEAIDARLAALGDRYRRTRERQAAAEVAARAAEIRIGDAAAVEDAIAKLPAARADVDALEAGEAESRRLADQLAAARQAFAQAEAPIAAALTTWTAELAGDRRRVDELIAGVNALEPVVCEKCGHHNVVDQAGLRRQLVEARGRLEVLERNEPKEPSTLRRDRAALARLEGALRELAWDPAPLAAARAVLADLERVAARAEVVEQAREALDRERATVAAAADELAAIDAEGKAARAEQAAKADIVTAGAGVEARERALETDRDAIALELEAVERRGRDIAEGLAYQRAQVERRTKLQADVAVVTERLEAADVELRRLRRLVELFGVTGIPARIIEGVLPELAGYANELLAELRPGMTLELRAQRAKRDGKGTVEALDLIVRDDVGERGLALFSGGERMSVSLAIAVGLSRLVARRAGSAIRSLVVDEPDGLDADARRAFGQALRVLAHHGDLERVVLVSHHPDLAEYADTVWSVSKSGSGSVVTEAA